MSNLVTNNYSFDIVYVRVLSFINLVSGQGSFFIDVISKRVLELLHFLNVVLSGTELRPMGLLEANPNCILSLSILALAVCKEHFLLNFFELSRLKIAFLVINVFQCLYKDV